MPNRIIKESICTSEQIDELSWFEETFFYRLLVNCDDYGCMDAREKVITAKLFPLKHIRPSEIIKALYKLAANGLIILYEADGKPLLKVTKWADHQRVRISKHKYPEPTEEQIDASLNNLRQFAASCGELRRVAESRGELRPESNPIQSNTNPNPNPNPTPTRAGARETDTDSDVWFSEFWTEYPKKVDKQNAVKAWKKIKPDAPLMAAIMTGLKRWKTSYEWLRDGGRFIPYPATWLNGRRWEDEIQETRTALPAQEYHQRDYSDEQEAAFRRMMELGGDDGAV